MLSCTMRYTASSSSGDSRRSSACKSSVISACEVVCISLHSFAIASVNCMRSSASGRSARTERRTSFMPSRAVDAMRSICFFAISGEISSICRHASAPAVMPAERVVNLPRKAVALARFRHAFALGGVGFQLLVHDREPVVRLLEFAVQAAYR